MDSAPVVEARKFLPSNFFDYFLVVLKLLDKNLASFRFAILEKNVGGVIMPNYLF